MDAIEVLIYAALIVVIVGVPTIAVLLVRAGRRP